MTNREVKIVNLTPHEVTVVSSNGDVLMKIPASGQVARCSVTRTVLGTLNGIPVAKSVMGDVEGLPKQSNDTVYIVSRVVAETMKGIRNDLIIPDDAVRDGEGRIIGCKGFAIV
jgi:hypothetical protein